MTSVYAPLEQWVSEGLIQTPQVFQRGPSRITEYDPVMRGNVVPGEIDISDPGQLGRANLPSIHAKTDLADPHVGDYPPNSEMLDTVIPRAMRWIGLRGSSYDPFLYTDVRQDTDVYTASAGVAQMPFGPAGAGSHPTEIGEHGPITPAELEAHKGVRQPMPVQRRSWLRRLFLLPPKTVDPVGGRSENVIPQMGQPEKDQDYRSDAAVAIANQFVIPDVRRTFDYPADAPGVKDSSGTVIYDNAGYPLTATPLEGSEWDIQTAHVFPNYTNLTEKPVGDAVGRVRAGVQYDYAHTRPSGMPHWFYFRPYDKWASDHTLALKGQLRPPSISRPIQTQSEPAADDRWAAGRRFGFPAAGMNPIGPNPNINRQAPQSWDTQLYQDYVPSNDVRAAAWRLG